MKALPLSLLLLAATCLFRLPADEIVWPLKPAPTTPGANLAITPAPRLEWLQRVQKSIDMTKGKKYDFILEGDSITDGWQGKGKALYDQLVAKYHAFDFGISGDRTENVLWRVEQGQLDGQDPKLVMLMIGTNNLGNCKNEQIAAGVNAVLDTYEKHCPSAHILLLGIFPRGHLANDPNRPRITAINEQLAHRPDQDPRVTYLDIGAKFLADDGTLTPEIMPDFLHPSAAGYQIWLDAVQPVLDQYLGVPAAPAKP